MTAERLSPFYGEVWANRGAEIHEIEDGIFVGSVHASTNLKCLQGLRINHIMVVHPSLAMLWPEKLSYCRISLDDTPVSNLLEVLPEAFQFLAEALQHKGRVLVHCTRGISRSTSIVIAFLMFQKALTYQDARRRVVQKRMVAYPNLGFEVQLQYFESLLATGRNSGDGDIATLKWLSGAVPRGDLTAEGCAFNVSEAMSQPTRHQLDTVQVLGEKLLSEPALSEQRRPWTSHGQFFEVLQKYKTIPNDSSLLSLAVAVAERLRRSVRLLDEGPSSVLAGIQAALDLAGEIETWIRIASPTLKQDPCLADPLGEKPSIAASLVSYASDSSSDGEDCSRTKKKREH